MCTAMALIATWPPPPPPVPSSWVGSARADAPSLALIVPVVHRGLRDRMGDTKKRAARIVGNMCTLVNDPKASGAE